MDSQIPQMWIQNWNKRNIKVFFGINGVIVLLGYREWDNKQPSWMFVGLPMQSLQQKESLPLWMYIVQYTIYNIQYTIYNIQYTIYNILGPSVG